MKEYMAADIDEAIEKAREREIVVNLDVLDRVSNLMERRKAKAVANSATASP
jgi:predicted nucleic acid-binding protein